MVLRLCWMVYSTMLEEASLRLGMSRKKDLQANMRTGSISILMEIQAMVMDSGMKDGKVIMNL